MTDSDASTVPAPEPPPWHALSAEEVARLLGADLERGLTSDEATARLHRFGRNQLAPRPRRSWLLRLLDQFRSLVVWVLLAAVLVSALAGDVGDALVIVAILVLNAVLGFVQEGKAEQSLAALQRLATPRAHALRDGAFREIPRGEVVPGDVVLLEAGSFVPADCRLVDAANLAADEAPLTGESLPVPKRPDTRLAPEAPLAERVTLAFAGTTITSGRGRGLVFATGGETEIGRIARLLETVEEEQTPLQRRLEGLGKSLAVAVLGICAIVFVVDWLRGEPVLESLLTAVGLAVAAVPEGLPAVVTIVLAVGTANMVQRHVIVRRLYAVEALGSTTVICTDKTGTLTQNAMTVRRFWTAGGTGSITGSGRMEGPRPSGEFSRSGSSIDPRSFPTVWQLLRLAVLCNDARLTHSGDAWHAAGDPTEIALLVAAAKAGVFREELEREQPRLSEVPFDADRKRMSTLHPVRPDDGSGYRLTVKGAPDEILPRCVRLATADGVHAITQQDRDRIAEVIHNFGEQALRVLGFAYRDFAEMPPELTPEGAERELTFVGLMGMIDPPRAEAVEAIRRCGQAGIRPVMITGDNPATAHAVAQEVGLLSGEQEVVTGAALRRLSDDALLPEAERIGVFARVSPEDKLRIVTALQARGHVVAMTGDGVNDAPALKKADIGVAMGITGTDVAKGAADLVLTDDNFASIVAAVEEGRAIFSNIRRFVFYLLSCNISEILTIFLATLVGLPPPLLPVQILWINLVTDGLPALALGVEPKNPTLMQRPPRPPREPVLSPDVVRDILWYGGFITIATLAAYAYGLYWRCLVPHGHVGWDAVRTALHPSFWNDPSLAHGLRETRTLVFGTLAFSQLAHALNSRSAFSSLLRLGLWTNPQLIGALVLSSLAQLVVLYVPFLQRLFGTSPVTGRELLVVVLLSASPLLFGEARKWLRRRGRA